MTKTRSGKTATDEIRSSMRLLNLLGLFIILSLLFVIFRYLFRPIQQALSFLPDASIAVILVAVIVLAVTGIIFSSALSRQIVRKIDEHNKRLDSILTITQDMKEEIYGDILLEKIINFSLAITGAEAGLILLLDEDNLVYSIVKGSAPEGLVGKTIPRDKGIAGWVLKQGEPIAVGDVREDSRYDASSDTFAGYEPVSLLCVPLTTKSSTLGIIKILSGKKDFFGGKDIEVIRYLADQAATSIEKTRFYDDQRNYEIHITDMLLDAIDRFMPEKKGHSKRVAQYANVIAKALDMPEAKKRRLYFASLLHDIGFLRLSPQNIFEKETFMQHTVIGYEMLHPITFYRDIAYYVLCLHERYDGTGYPKGLRGADIPLESRIIAIAEAFDSMVSKMSYRVSVNFDVAIDELLKNRGSQFDAELVDLFVKEIKEPLG
ncbi:MAG TPA: HD domain-containing phosphohydrolase [Thermodesulfovibrionales bacterium]|nr:HD domain-containing phosphohydrolase [Thermodesulfovibrionales bacterium]